MNNKITMLLASDCCMAPGSDFFLSHRTCPHCFKPCEFQSLPFSVPTDDHEEALEQQAANHLHNQKVNDPRYFKI